MRFRKRYIKILSITLLLLCSSYIGANQVQLITTHKKSNGTLLRIVTSSVLDIENIAGWSGQENWFYITLNGTSLSPSAVDYIAFEPPLIDIEITENNESVQLGYLFDRPIEDFEIFHSNASRVVLIQIWESLNDSVRSEVRLSEGTNNNRVFSLPKNESKGSPFHDSFVYAREKYGSEKYFVWYNNWYSTKDVPDTLMEFSSSNQIKKIPKITKEELLVEKNKNLKLISKDPEPLIVKRQIFEVSGPPLPEVRKISRESVDISFILNKGLLITGSKRVVDVKALQKALIFLGYYLGSTGIYNDGVDGDFGSATEEAVMQFQLDRGFNNSNVDGIVGEGTHKELKRALSGKESVIKTLSNESNLVQIKESNKKINKNSSTGRIVMENKFGSVIQQQNETARELLNQPPITTQIKRETRILDNTEELNLLPPDLSKRKTFLKLTCNLEGANVFIDGSLIGITPLPKKLAVTPGWHRVRIVDPNTPRPQFAMAIPDYQDIYVPKGRTQKIRINLAVEDEEE